MKTVQAYDLVLRPVITEKSTMASEHNQVLFRVPLTATKSKIKKAVEALFDVKVTGVNTMRVKGKQKRLRTGQRTFRSDWKKAIVTLEEGQSIDVTTGL